MSLIFYKVLSESRFQEDDPRGLRSPPDLSGKGSSKSLWDLRHTGVKVFSDEGVGRHLFLVKQTKFIG